MGLLLGLGIPQVLSVLAQAAILERVKCKLMPGNC